MDTANLDEVLLVQDQLHNSNFGTEDKTANFNPSFVNGHLPNPINFLAWLMLIQSIMPFTFPSSDANAQGKTKEDSSTQHFQTP